MKKRVGLDSQCFSYLLDALEGVDEPVGTLADEKLALVRIWLYTHGPFFLPQTVVAECARIRQEQRRAMHDSWRMAHFVDLPVRDAERIVTRVSTLRDLHPGESDCRILAEAEDVNLDVLLSYDDSFLRHLECASESVSLVRPCLYLRSLAIKPNASPITVPDASNPLAQESWWRI